MLFFQITELCVKVVKNVIFLWTDFLQFGLRNGVSPSLWESIWGIWKQLVYSMYCPRIHSRYQILSVWIPPCGCSPYRDLWVPWYNFTRTPQQYGLHFLNILSRDSDVFLTKSQYMTFMFFNVIIQPKMTFCHHFHTLISFPNPYDFVSSVEHTILKVSGV